MRQECDALMSRSLQLGPRNVAKIWLLRSQCPSSNVKEAALGLALEGHSSHSRSPDGSLEYMREDRRERSKRTPWQRAAKEAMAMESESLVEILETYRQFDTEERLS
ncbi:hypothetical protein PM082_016275 [Marasmius tenuissimus]|nr:hypothetical protein PM082_016275 [Marasmius tenuissimus]